MKRLLDSRWLIVGTLNLARQVTGRIAIGCSEGKGKGKSRDAKFEVTLI